MVLLFYPFLFTLLSFKTETIFTVIASDFRVPEILMFPKSFDLITILEFSSLRRKNGFIVPSPPKLF